MKALGMVIFNHIRSRTSSPDSELAIALTTAGMSLWMVRWCSSSAPGTQQSIEGLLGGRWVDGCCLGGWMGGDGGSLTVVWEEPARHGGGVGHPGSRVNGTNRLTFRRVEG